MPTVKPTIKSKIVTREISFLGLEINFWDLGGQASFRKKYLEHKDKYFLQIQSFFYIIDIQAKERFEESLKYLKEIVNAVLEINPNFSQFLILFHKNDPDLINNKVCSENLDFLEKKIKTINPNVNFTYYCTSIFDESSLIKAFSDGAISITQRSKMIQTLLSEYTKKTYSSAAVLLDQQSFIIASRSTNESYQQICESVAPRLAYTMEKLEEWKIDTVDIVTTIKFPHEDMKNDKEGIIFLRKLDVKNERLYLVSLCLNRKIQVKSYEYLPQLAENLKNLLESLVD
jgi:hypothetical protein